MAIRIDRRAIRFFFQRLLRGWDDGDTFSLDHTAAIWMLPRLQRFRELTCAHPSYMTYEEWLETLDKMIYSLEVVSNPKKMWAGGIDWREDGESVQEGLELLGKHWLDLWW